MNGVRPPQDDFRNQAEKRHSVFTNGVLIFIPFAVALGLALTAFPFMGVHLLALSNEVAINGDHASFVSFVFLLLAGIAFFAAIRWSAILFLSYLGFRHYRRLSNDTKVWPRVSIIVPAFNEEQTMEWSLRSLLELDYPDYEIVVVDDGSTDKTLALARPFAGRYNGCEVRVHTKPNGGKWAALNHGFHRSTGELVLCVDADSRLGDQALRSLVNRMADSGVSAVAGHVYVRNRINVLTRLQALEYAWCGIVRMAQSFSRSVLVVPGPIGLFRRCVLEDVFVRFGAIEANPKKGEVSGPFEGSTFAEDFDLSAAILTLGGRIVYEPQAVSYTTAPTSVYALLNQRYRWVRGSLQTVTKYFRRAWSNPTLRHPWVTAWMIATYITDVVSLPFFLGVITSIIVHMACGGDPIPVLSWMLLFLVLSLNAQSYAVAMHGEKVTLLRMLLVYDFYQGLMLNGALVIGVIDELRRSRMRW